MDKELILNKVMVRKSSIHGYGVFAKQDIYPNEIIEESYCVTSGESKDTALLNYYFRGSKDKSLLIVLGYGSIYNHSAYPNTTYIYDSERRVMVYSSTKFIKKDEEIFVSYGKNWFDQRSFRKKEIRWMRKSWKFISGIPLRALIVCSIVWSIVIAVRVFSHYSGI